jgi:YVTN family beta-propeller protein/cysteine-rich repeat protein
VFLSGDDAEDATHCFGNRCGGLYSRALSTAVAEGGGNGQILAVGIQGGPAAQGLDSWNAPANGGPGAPIVTVTGAAISTVGLTPYAVVYIPAGAASTVGGITDDDLARLATRKDAVAAFLDRGGSLIALTEAEADPSVAYRWLPFSLTAAPAMRCVVSPTAELFALFPGIPVTIDNLSHCFYHNVWTGPPGFAGLRALAVEEESGQRRPVILAGGLVVTEPCGNGRSDPGEECDDGNTIGGDGCSPTCQREGCGNGRPDPGEECDDGNTTAGDGCSPSCQRDGCGNGRADAGEECDDGNTTAGDGCSPTCRREICGNGQPDPGEECDDGNATAGDGCSPACQREVCGNGRREPAEGCDDGNTTAGDGCSQACQREICGNGRRDHGEECDDGNENTDDCCATCLARAEGISCGDADACNGDELCTAGVCIAPTKDAALECLSAKVLVLVTNFEDDTLTIVDATTDTVAASVSVGDGPWAAALHPLGTETYVTNREGSSVSVLDLASRTVQGTIAVGGQPHGVVFDPAGARAYVASFDADAIFVIDTASRTVRGTIPVGLAPVGLSLSPGSTHLYVSNYGSNDVSVIDTTTETVIATVPTGRRPLQMAVDAVQGRLYVTNFDSGSVSVIGLASNSVLATIDVGRKPFGIAIDERRARAYVTNAASDTVSVIDTRTLATIATIPMSGGPLGISLDPAGARAFVARTSSNELAVIDASATRVSAVLPVGRVPVAFGAFVGPAANACPRAPLVCDDTIPATLDGCAPASGCTHAIHGEPEAAEAGVTALEREIVTAVDGGGVAPEVLEKLQPLLDSVRDLLAPTTTPEGQNLKKRLKRADRQLRRIQRLLKRALRDGTIDREVGLRLLDLLRGTRESIRRTLRASRPRRNLQVLVRPSVATGSRTFGSHAVDRPLPPLSD